jgi:hypothetical protein
MVNYFNCVASYLTGDCIIMEDGLVIRYDPILPERLTCSSVENREV